MESQLIAIPVYEDRISPLLDVSERFVLFEVRDKMITQRIVISINAESERMRIHKLKELGIGVIISGAVSRYLSFIIVETGIRLILWISGRVDDAIDLFLNNTLQPVRPERGSCGGMMRKRKLVQNITFGSDPAKNERKEII